MAAAPSQLHRQETFRTAMRNNAMEYDEADAVQPSQDGLNFVGFCAMVRERELGEHTDDELRARFIALDITGTGKVEKHEYLRFCLRDALSRSVTRVKEIFAAWDEGEYSPSAPSLVHSSHSFTHLSRPPALVHSSHSPRLCVHRWLRDD